MNIVLSWLAIAGAAVLWVAVAVAWFEHRRRVAARRKDAAWFDTEIDMGALAGAAALDLNLDPPPGQPANRLEPIDEEREQSARQAVLAAALNRMARHNAEPNERNAWAETQPQVAASPSGSTPGKTRSTVE